MRERVLVILAVTLIAPCSSLPDDVDDFNRISSSLTQQISSGLSQQNRGADIKITDEKHIKKIEIKSQGSDRSSQLAQFSHQGNNLFFKPQILVGTNIGNPFISPELDNDKNKDIASPGEKLNNNNTNTSKEGSEILSDVPEAPILPPLVMPDLPKIEIIEEPKPKPPCDDHSLIDDTSIEPKNPIVIPEPPTIIPLIPPKIEIIVPKPVPAPTCLIDNINYGVTVPCPPFVAVSPGIINVEKVVAETVIIPESPPLLSLPLPKIPLGVVYNKPVKTIVPYSEGFVSTTRYLPSVKVSKFPLDMFNRPKLVEIPSRPLHEIVVEKIRGETIELIDEVAPLTSFSAYCAHNIALERVLPNIVVGKGIINIAPVLPILEIPVRPIY